MVTGGLTSLYRPEVDNLVARLKSERAPDQHDEPYDDKNPTTCCFVHLQFPLVGECVFSRDSLVVNPCLCKLDS